MFKRRSIIAAFLVVALLAVGIGFAYVTDTLTVGGDVSVGNEGAQEAFDELVYFDAVTEVDTTNGVVATIDSTDKDKATIEIKGTQTALKVQNDETTVILKIVNKSTYDATLAATADTSALTTDFSMTHGLYSDEACTTPATSIAASTGVAYLKVVVKLVSDPTTLDSGAKFSGTFGITITATTVDP